MTERRFHPSYRLWWLAWGLAGVAILLLREHLPGGSALWVQLHVAWLLLLEGIAIRREDKGLADALSPLMQALADRASPGAKWHQGYRALTAGIAGLVSLECSYAVSLSWGWWLGGWVGGILFLWLVHHWVFPEKYDR